jgi:hypothetical protein
MSKEYWCPGEPTSLSSPPNVFVGYVTLKNSQEKLPAMRNQEDLLGHYCVWTFTGHVAFNYLETKCVFIFQNSEE